MLNYNLEIKVKEEIDKNRQKDQIIIKQQKQSAMGALLGIIAHQLKQPLNAISMSKEIIKIDFEDDCLTEESIKKFDDRVTKQINFMSESIDDLRNFFNPNKKSKPFLLEEAIKKITTILSVDISRKGINLQIDIKDDITIDGYENEIEQVVLNIVNNAKDVLLEMKPVDPKIQISAYGQNNKAIITIKDNGGGIPENIIDKIFDSYFSTKGAEGTGIGLNLARMIVEDNMGGKISVKNCGEGAEFTIELKKS
jgi:signal transduction histidine kinase